MRFEGQTAIVTGGASGIGKGTVELLVAEGGRVLIADIQDDRAAWLTERFGERVHYQRCDVTSEADIAKAVDDVQARWGRLDLMFNNAGVPGDLSPISEMSNEGWSRGHDVLLRSAMLGTKHAARVMRPQGTGCIICTSSVGALMTGVAPSAYSILKAGVIQLVRVAAAELASSCIRVNAICPGYIATPMLWTDTDVAPEAEDRLVAAVAEARRGGQPLPVGGLPRDIAEAVLYLAASSGRFVTGANLVVDGGMSLGKTQEELAANQEEVNRVLAESEAN